MRIKLFLTALIISFAAMPSFAGITPEEASSAGYLYTHGHSAATVDIVQKSKANINGEEYISAEEAKHANHSGFVRWVRRVFIYLDPALDDGTFMNHDIKSTPGYEDL